MTKCGRAASPDETAAHIKACAGLERARRDTDVEAQSRALARVSHMSGAPEDAQCLFCLDGTDAAEPLVRGCACRGTAGWTHMGCLVKWAEAARAPPPSEPHFAPWIFCQTCKQRFTGLVQLRLAITLWAKFTDAATDGKKLAAASSYAAALSAAGEHAEAVRLKRGILFFYTQTLGPEHCETLTCASNLAASLGRLGECAEAAGLLRATLVARTRTIGVDDRATLVAESHLVNVLHSLGEYEEAEEIGRSTLAKQQRILGLDHRQTLVTSANLAISLGGQGKHAQAVEIGHEVHVSMVRAFGAEHEQALISSTNLARMLAKCGRKQEARQILIGTLALSVRALGPTHEHTLRALRIKRALGN